MDILLPALNATLDRGFQVALFGTGMPHYQEALERLASRFPKQVAVTIGYSNALAHQIEAGSDFFLMPSRFEPCGLNQMCSLRYGSVPIVRNIGGLRDSVTGLQEDPQQADGIKFQAFSVSALIAAVEEALKLFEDPPRLKGGEAARHAERFFMGSDIGCLSRPVSIPVEEKGLKTLIGSCWVAPSLREIRG